MSMIVDEVLYIDEFGEAIGILTLFPMYFLFGSIGLPLISIFSLSLLLLEDYFLSFGMMCLLSCI